LGEPVKNDGRGFIGGGQIGYNLQVGNIVLGIEGTLSHANLDDDHTSIFNPFVTYSTDINWIGTVAGRLGVAHDRFLAYVKAGWATANIEVSGRESALPDAFSIDDRRNGWVAGGGFEYMFSRNLSLGVEYNYIDFGSESYTGITRQGFAFTIRDVDMDVQTVTARVNFRFGGDHARPLK
jgi:outer membrane immunogenic protein